jgi:hypothetical protein
MTTANSLFANDSALELVVLEHLEEVFFGHLKADKGLLILHDL